MNCTKLNYKLMGWGAICLLLGSFGATVVQAQNREPTVITTTECEGDIGENIKTDGGYRFVRDRQIERIDRYWYTGKITCEIDGKYSILQLEFAMKDGAGQKTIDIYLDGEKKGSLGISGGERKSLPLDVTNINNVHIEIEGGGYFYVHKADLIQ